MIKKKERPTLQDSDSRMIGEQLSFAASEAYKLLRTNLMFALPDEQRESDDEKRCRVIGITSAESGEGKSTTALNLSYMLAETNNKVLLIEADMRLPSLYQRVNLQQSPGLSNLLAGLSNGSQALQKSSIHPHLYMVTSGDIPPNPSELLGSEQMRTMVRTLSQNFNYMILDLPPVNEVSDALVASKLTDGMLMVVRQNMATRGSVNEAMRQLEYANAKVLGFVMTCVESDAKGYRKYSYYGYGERKRPKP